ncbi:MAG TPA: class I SAM-dependent methyltransferase [Gemmatimonadales bacterium]|nr:class I SAM-dependent methyltransferase [Gemmatimonadales bacterium]
MRGLALARCSSCGVTCLEPEPGRDSLLDGFQDSYFQGGHRDGYRDYLAIEPAARRQARRYLETLARLDPGGRTLVDVGCAAGFLLAEAEAAGWVVSGIEPSPGMAREARRRIAGAVTVGDVISLPASTPALHVVTMVNVLEHLTQPAAVAERLAQLVRPGGILLIETWNAESMAARLLGSRWHQWSPLVPYYYTRRGLRTLLGSSFREILWRRAAKWIPLARGAEILAPGVARRLVRAGSLCVPYFTGDLVLSCWRRTD